MPGGFYPMVPTFEEVRIALRFLRCPAIASARPNLHVSRQVQPVARPVLVALNPPERLPTVGEEQIVPSGDAHHLKAPLRHREYREPRSAPRPRRRGPPPQVGLCLRSFRARPLRSRPPPRIPAPPARPDSRSPDRRCSRPAPPRSRRDAPALRPSD